MQTKNTARQWLRRKSMRCLTTVAAVALAGASYAQLPWNQTRSDDHAWMLYRPQKTRINVVTDARVGQIRMKIESVKLDGKDCKLYSWSTALWPHAGGPDMEIDTASQTWVDESGKVLKIVSTYERGSYKATATAVFKGDEVEVTTDNREGKKSTTLFPAGGVGLFNQAFGSFMKEERKVGDAWDWYTLDPLKGVPVKNSAKVRNSFKAKFGDVVYEGLSYEITNSAGTVRAYVSKQGELLQMDFTNGVRIYPDFYVPTWRVLESPGVPPP